MDFFIGFMPEFWILPSFVPLGLKFCQDFKLIICFDYKYYRDIRRIGDGVVVIFRCKGLVLFNFGAYLLNYFSQDSFGREDFSVLVKCQNLDCACAVCCW